MCPVTSFLHACRRLWRRPMQWWPTTPSWLGCPSEQRRISAQWREWGFVTFLLEHLQELACYETLPRPFRCKVCFHSIRNSTPQVYLAFVLHVVSRWVLCGHSDGAGAYLEAWWERAPLHNYAAAGRTYPPGLWSRRSIQPSTCSGLPGPSLQKRLGRLIG